MDEYKDEESYDVLSLSDLQMDEVTIDSEEAVNTSTFDQDFFGISSQEYYNKNSRVKGRKPAKKVEETNPMFRSNSGSFRYMRFKVGSRTGSWRSQSLSVMASKSKSRWQVFMFGSGRFPTKMDLIDIKSRQLRSQSTTKVSQDVDDHAAGVEDSGGRRISGRKKVWWRLVDVLGCGGGGY